MDIENKELKEISQLKAIYESVPQQEILEGEQAIVIHAERNVERQNNTTIDNDAPTL